MTKYNSILNINEILDEYSKDIQDGITEKAISVAKKGADELKTTSPKKKGKYRRGWRVKTQKGYGYINCIIHNATDYQLTHLLEKPHATRNGSKTKPKVHIAPVEEKCNQEYLKEVENVIRDGG